MIDTSKREVLGVGQHRATLERKVVGGRDDHAEHHRVADWQGDHLDDRDDAVFLKLIADDGAGHAVDLEFVNRGVPTGGITRDALGRAVDEVGHVVLGDLLVDEDVVQRGEADNHALGFRGVIDGVGNAAISEFKILGRKDQIFRPGGCRIDERCVREHGRKGVIRHRLFHVGNQGVEIGVERGLGNSLDIDFTEIGGGRLRHDRRAGHHHADQQRDQSEQLPHDMHSSM